MILALFLIALVIGIVVISRRWPDVEAKLWPDQMDLPEHAESGDEPAHSSVGGAVKSVRDVVQEKAEKITETAGGLMKKKAVSAEPEVEARTKPPKAVAEAEPTAATTTEPTSPIAEPPSPTRAVPKRPGGLVTGTPARPSQPAYVDATKRSDESFEHLAEEADKAWKDRDYERCEQACLKILIQQPKNHKYMTRIGQAYRELGQLDDAREAFEAAKNLDPKNFFVLNQLAEVERLISDKGGRTAAKKAIKRSAVKS